MQIVVPMSGFGERFRRAGYAVPKPLIEVEGRPIVAHVIDLFPGETDFIFICNQDHLDHPDYRMREVLQAHCPTGRVVGIAPHKLGPVHAVRQVAHLLRPDEPVVVNYCDFACYWDWPHFKRFVQQTRCSGAIPAYKGFHPHCLGSTNYAYLREAGGWVSDIQEKQPFTDDRMQEFASSGTYYFRSGRLMSQAFEATMAQNLHVNGEFYVSLAYRPLLAQKEPVAVYPLQHFMQWGTPEDLAEYQMWSRAFQKMAMPAPSTVLRAANKSVRTELVEVQRFQEGNDLLSPNGGKFGPNEERPRENGVSGTAVGQIIIPMAGLGQRFAQEGYALTKPLIPVSGAPMVLQAARDLPPAQRAVFVVRQDMPGVAEVAKAIQQAHPGALIKTIEGVTEGQACTALIGLDALEAAEVATPETAAQAGPVMEPLTGALMEALTEPLTGPLTIGACDNGAIYDPQAWTEWLQNPDVDVAVWTVRGYPNAQRKPQMFGWVDEEGGRVKSISVKTPLQNPARDPIVLGTFSFKRAADFRRVVERLIARDGRINGEFYIDSCINDAIALGLRVQCLEVEHYLCWGTPNDLRTFEYWQSCFDKWPAHVYRLENDARVPSDQVEALRQRYAPLAPVAPECPQGVCATDGPST